LNYRKWQAGKAKQTKRARAGADARWAAVREARAEEPVRRTRVVELTIRDSHRPGTVVRLSAEEGARGWGRWAVEQDGARIGKRRLGKAGIARMLAAFLA